jgi:hypothetical protein
VRAADDDRPAKSNELGEKLRARPTLDPAGVRSRHHDLEARRRFGLATKIDVDALQRIVSRASQPRTSAPQAREKLAYADSPAPPIPTK